MKRGRADSDTTYAVGNRHSCRLPRVHMDTMPALQPPAEVHQVYDAWHCDCSDTPHLLYMMHNTRSVWRVSKSMLGSQWGHSTVIQRLCCGLRDRGHGIPHIVAPVPASLNQPRGNVCPARARRMPCALPLYYVSYLWPQVCPHLGKSPKSTAPDRKPSLQGTLHKTKYEISTTQNGTPTASNHHPCHRHKVGAKDGPNS